MKWLRQWLAYPLTRGLDLDDPRTTQLRRRIIAEKPFLRALYREWYARIAQALPDGEEPVLELGSGAGFLDEYVPGLITSEVFHCDGVRAVLNGHRLPFADASLRAIVMTDVLHHLPAARRFFREAARCVRRGGAVIMIEPWATPWSRFIYTRLHHEPFQADVKEWEFPSSGPLSGANGALPWIIFERDRAQFEREFPEWSIQGIELLTPFRYLLSGGISMRSLMPGWSFGAWRLLERGLSPWLPQLAMFARITLRREV
ncbi:MAG: class I SAM-dependent methyltransferase [Nevskiales bacterium]